MATRLKDLLPILVRNYIARVNTFIRGKPAIGKTETIAQFAERMKTRVPGFKVWMFYAPTMSPMDIQASAPNYETHLLEMFNNAALPNHYTTPDAVGVVFFGELPNADPATTKLLQKYVNGEDMSGVLRKPEGVVVIADGNRIEDKSGVQQQGRAFLSRFEQLEAYTDASDNLAYAMAHAWHPYVQKFMETNPALIDNYDDVFETSAAARQRSAQAKAANGADQQAEEGKLGIWANMRSWERMSRKEYAADQLRSPVTLAEACGNVGSGVGAQYEAHKRMMMSLTSLEEIVADPANARLPTAMDEQYALSMLIAHRCNETQLPQIYTYACRMPLELQASIVRHLGGRKNFNLGASDAFAKWNTNPALNQLLNGVSGR
jgi:hypothetical protein